MSSVVAVDKVDSITEDEGIQTSGRIPKEAAFFQDHFPAFPILPGVLALDLLRQSAERYLKARSQDSETKYRLKSVRAVKFTHYLKPNDVWESQSKLLSEKDGVTTWKGHVVSQGQVAVSARWELRLVRK